MGKGWVGGFQWRKSACAKPGRGGGGGGGGVFVLALAR